MFQFLEDFFSENIRFSLNEDISNKKNCYKCIHRRLGTFIADAEEYFLKSIL